MTPAHQAIAAAKAAFLLIWPGGTNCQHEHARAGFEALEAAERQTSELRDALESMCHQYLSVSNGKLHHDFMSAGEAAFDALGWDDAGHPVSKDALCEVSDCGSSWSCGFWGRDGKYHTTCGHHHAGIEKETNDQAAARHADDLRNGMHFQQDPAVHILMDRWKINFQQASELWEKAAKLPPHAVIEIETPADIENQIGG
jgi:hypothetical protein